MQLGELAVCYVVQPISYIPDLQHLATTATSFATKSSVLHSELLEPHVLMQLAEAAAGSADNITCLARASTLAGRVHQGCWSQGFSQLKAHDHQKLGILDHRLNNEVHMLEIENLRPPLHQTFQLVRPPLPCKAWPPLPSRTPLVCLVQVKLL